MYRSSSRNQRSKGVKVKHALQICLLVAVCFWLIYQVKHSYDKKKEFDDNDAKISNNIQTHNEVLKLGRKDLHPQVKETEKHDEEAEEDIEDIDIKVEEREEEVKAGGDDDVDKHDQEKSDSQLDREEEFIDEEKELEEGNEKEIEEKEDREKERKTENESSLDNLGLGRGTNNTHEAREQQYKADDASSAVTHDGQSISSENVSGSTENQTSIVDNENKGNNTEINSTGRNATDLKVGEDRAGNGTSSTVNQEKGAVLLNSTSQGSSYDNSTMTSEFTDQLKLWNDSAEVNTESHDMLNGTEINQITMSDPSHAQNASGGGSSAEGSNILSFAEEQANSSSIASDDSQFTSNATAPSSSGTVESNPGVPSKFPTNSTIIASENSVLSNVSAETKNGPEITELEENRDAHQNERSDTTGETDEKYGGSDTLNIDNADEVQSETLDSSIHLEDKLADVDLDMLPDVRVDESNSEEAAEE